MAGIKRIGLWFWNLCDLYPEDRFDLERYMQELIVN